MKLPRPGFDSCVMRRVNTSSDLRRRSVSSWNVQGIMNTRCNWFVNARSQAVCRSKVLNLVLGDITDRRFINSLQINREILNYVDQFGLYQSYWQLALWILKYEKRREIYNKTEVLICMKLSCERDYYWDVTTWNVQVLFICRFYIQVLFWFLAQGYDMTWHDSSNTCSANNLLQCRQNHGLSIINYSFPKIE